MTDIEKLDDTLYIAAYGLPKKGDVKQIWEEIKKDPEVLREAVEIKKDKFGERNIVKGLAIADSMLIDYKDVDKVAYNKLIEAIYSDTDIARIVIGGAANGGFSFLLMSLCNHDLKLTEEQKAFAVSEAMNKIGTKKYQEATEAYSRELEEKGITDDIVTTIDLDGSINPIGAKTKNEYLNYLFSALSTKQAHGSGYYDIRYQILRNPNWTIEEKQKLIMDFWYDDDDYDEHLEQWEWGIANDEANYKGNSLPLFDKSEMYEYSYELLLKFYGNKEKTDEIWNEINFCKQMHQLRPQQWEREYKKKKKSFTENK